MKKVHKQFCNYVLGVNSKSSNLGVLSELGQFPLLLSVITGSLNFWLHIIGSDGESLLSKEYIEQINTTNNKSGWIQFIKSVLIDLGFCHIWLYQSTFNSSALLNAVKNKLKDRFISFGEKRMASNTGMARLQTYTLFKQKFRTLFRIYTRQTNQEVFMFA